MRIAVVVFEGFDELDAIGPLEVLRNAATMGDVDLQVDLVALDGRPRSPAPTASGSGPTAGSTRTGPDVVVVPGGGWNDRAPRGARAEAERGELPAALAAANRSGAVVATVCTGAMLADAVAAEIEHPRSGEVWRATPGRGSAR